MVATICLLTALLPGQSADRAETLLAPRLGRGQELVYRGTCTEEALGKGVQFTRTYKLESRVFVLETPSRGLDVAVYTVLRHAGQTEREAGIPSSVRLELAHVNLQGRGIPEGDATLQLPLDALATLECGAFVEVPKGRVSQGQSWEVADPGRPAQTWRLIGSEVINGTSCLKLVGRQQSDDWDQPRADRSAWQREDTVWIATRLGAAFRVERTILRRDPARREPTQRLATRYELESSIQYPNQMYEDRRREIFQARSFATAAQPLLPNPAKHAPKTFEALLNRITYHLDKQPPTPYRDAVLHVRRRVDAARRGEAPALVEESTAPSVATLGHRAPDFMTANLLTRESVRLNQLLGKPLVLVFYSPGSQTVDEVLRFVQSLQDAHPQTAGVAGLVLTDDLERVRKQHAALGLSYPVLAGKALRQTYGVDATPRLVVLDGSGVVRGSFVGWGPETATLVTEELRRWVLQDGPPRKDAGKRGDTPGTLTSRPPAKP